MSVNGTFVEDKMRGFKGVRIFALTSVPFALTTVQETDNSVGYISYTILAVFLWLKYEKNVCVLLYCTYSILILKILPVILFRKLVPDFRKLTVT